MKINIEFELEEINWTGKMSETELKRLLINCIDSRLFRNKWNGEKFPVFLYARDNENYVHTFKITINGKD